MNTFFFEDCTISECFRQQIEYLKGIGKVGTASKYETCKNLLEQCGLGRKRFEQVDLQFMQDFEAYMTRKGNSSNSLATSFSVLRAVYNKAVKQKVFAETDNPFKQYNIGKPFSLQGTTVCKYKKRFLRK